MTNLIQYENQIILGMVVFQTDHSNDQQSNNNKFDLYDVKNILFENNGKHFPKKT